MNLNHPDSPDVIQALETRCCHCGVRIEFLDSISQWWHVLGPPGRWSYRGCRDTQGHLTGKGHAEPEEAQ